MAKRSSVLKGTGMFFATKPPIFKLDPRNQKLTVDKEELNNEDKKFPYKNKILKS